MASDSSEIEFPKRRFLVFGSATNTHSHVEMNSLFSQRVVRRPAAENDLNLSLSSRKGRLDESRKLCWHCVLSMSSIHKTQAGVGVSLDVLPHPKSWRIRNRGKANKQSAVGIFWGLSKKGRGACLALVTTIPSHRVPISLHELSRQNRFYSEA